MPVRSFTTLATPARMASPACWGVNAFGSNDEAAFGTGTSTGLDSVRVDIAFIGVGGFAEDGGMTDYSITAAETRGKMILAGRAYLLADQTKFTRRTPFRVPNMDKCAGVIVDTMPDPGLASIWTAWGWNIIVAK